MCIYGSWAMASVLYGEVLDKNLLNATFFNAITGAEVQADYIIVFHYLFMRYFQISGVLLLLTVMSLMLGIFLGFHLYITSRNMTTNEFFKWRSVKKWHKKERQKFQDALKDKSRSPKSDIRATLAKQVPDGDVGCTGLTDKSQTRELEDDDIIDPGEMPKNIYE